MDFRHGRWNALGRFEDASTMRIELRRDGERLGRASTFAGLAGDVDARAAFIDLLRGSPYQAFFWETPPTIDDERLFECVLVDAPALQHTRPNPDAFAERWRADPGAAIASFPNLGGDAELVVPSPEFAGDGGHLAAFARTAPDELLAALLREVGVRALDRLDSRRGPIWVSTSGLGVPWLHVRLDERPKYYVHAPYRDARA